MERTTNPQTEGEWLIKLSGQIENLTKSINDLTNKLVDIEKVQITGIENRVSIIEMWQQQIAGAWKLVIVIWIVLTAIGFGAIVKLFSR